jgi:citronellyl-CoA dehydrogenase
MSALLTRDRAASGVAAALAGMRPEASGREVWRTLGAAGVLAGTYRGGQPEAGLEPARLGGLLAEVDARFPIGTTLAVCVQVATALPLLATGQGPAREVLAGALAGTTVVALGATDQGAGSDLAGLETEIHFEDGVPIVHGAKRWIANAAQAEYLLVLARHRPGRHFTNFTWVLVPASATGVTIEPADTQLFDGSGTGHIQLDRVRLSRDCLIGGQGRGLARFAAHIAVERLAGALWGVALCQRVLADTKRWLAGRRVAGGSLWQVDSIRQRFAACLVLVRQLRALTDDLGDRIARRHDTTAAAMLKASVAMTIDRVLTECAHLQGAEGFRSAGPQQLRAQAALFGIGGGSTEIVLTAVGDAADAVLTELSP